MRQFIKRALNRIEQLSPDQVQDLLLLAAKEIDRLETVMDSLIRGVLVCDTAHRLILANKAARRFLSIVSYEQGRETIWSLIPEEVVSEFLALTLMSADKVEEREFDVEVGGVERLISVSVMPVVQDRQVTGSLILVDDITERRIRESRMRRMENLASLTTLAAGIAHEIKNPLGSLSIHVQLIKKAVGIQEKVCVDLNRSDKHECDPFKHFLQINKYLEILNEEVERLNAIIVDFLFAVRPMNPVLRRGNINTLIEDLVQFVSLEMEAAKIGVTLDLAENLSTVDIDAGLMKTALLNLVKNAAAATEQGGKLIITTKETEGEVLISIADTGTGISEEDLNKIFEPYFTTKNNGTGLGLTVVFKVIKEHLGEIIVTSREGEGSVFTISLPIPYTERRLLTYNEPETVVSVEEVK
jgi:PAS domain S-box-containing protein